MGQPRNKLARNDREVDAMNIVIVTPGLKESAIGRMANLVSHALVSSGHEVSIVRSESEPYLERPTHDFPVEAMPWNDHARINDLLLNSDAVVYQIGDHFPYHKGCLEWIKLYPGTVCLHDFFLGSLFFGWLENNLAEAGAVLKNWYGAEAAEAFFNFSNVDEFIQNTKERSPLTEWICSMASGVVTHSSWGIDRVLNSCPGPVAVVPLAYDAKDLVDSEPLKKSKPDFRVLTVGNIIFNKRPHAVIEAIGSSNTLRDNTVYHLAGAVQSEMRERLSSLATNMGVKVVISGQLDDSELIDAFRQADVISCLRSPTLEAASASAIEAMLYGKPTIVSNAGFYREIPDPCVLKIEPLIEIAALRTALERLYLEPELRRTIGANAQEWAKRTFSPANYAAKLVDIAAAAGKAQPLITTATHFSTMINEWGGSESILNLEDTVLPLKAL